ncbi:MAG: hypothetical protein MI922_22570 [Bacteroidales bacterium]|nr:hypothetical protein [Bacteroidales bacterium]
MKNYIALVTVFLLNCYLFASIEEEIKVNTLAVHVNPQSVQAPGVNNNIFTGNGSGTVDVYTGRIQYNYPIATIATQHLNIPVSVNYVSQGIRIAENSSIVGQDWQLNAGGAITREMKGFPDELPDKGILHKYDDVKDFMTYDCSKKNRWL